MLKRLLSTFSYLLIILLLSLISPTSVKAAILFQDNFDSGDANWEVSRNMQWSNQSTPCYYQGSPTNWEIKNGRYGITIDGPGCVTESVPIDQVWNNAWNDYIFESDITFVDGEDANIAFRYKGDGVQLGRIMKITYQDSEEVPHEINYYIKTHQHGSLADSRTGSVVNIDLKELFVYKVL